MTGIALDQAVPSSAATSAPASTPAEQQPDGDFSAVLSEQVQAQGSQAATGKGVAKAGGEPIPDKSTTDDSQDPAGADTTAAAAFQAVAMLPAALTPVVDQAATSEATQVSAVGVSQSAGKPAAVVAPRADGETSADVGQVLTAAPLPATDTEPAQAVAVASQADQPSAGDESVDQAPAESGGMAESMKPGVVGGESDGQADEKPAGLPVEQSTAQQAEQSTTASVASEQDAPQTVAARASQDASGASAALQAEGAASRPNPAANAAGKRTAPDGEQPAAAGDLGQAGTGSLHASATRPVDSITRTVGDLAESQPKAEAEAQPAQDSGQQTSFSSVLSVEQRLTSAGSSTVGTQRPASTDAALSRRVIDQVVTEVSLQRSIGRSDLVVRLSPPELGTLRVRISQDGSGMVSSIQTSTDQVRNLIQAHLPMLQSALADAGVKVNSVSVTADANFSSLAQHTQQGSDQQQSGHRYRGPYLGSGGTASAAVGAAPMTARSDGAGYSWLA